MFGRFSASLVYQCKQTKQYAILQVANVSGAISCFLTCCFASEFCRRCSLIDVFDGSVIFYSSRRLHTQTYAGRFPNHTVEGEMSETVTFLAVEFITK